MPLSKLLITLGLILIIWGLISGFSFFYSYNASETILKSGYNLKFGTIIMGGLLVYFGRKMR